MQNRDDAILLVANYESDVGYAWWLMEAFWAQIAAHAAKAGRPVVLAYPRIARVPQVIQEARIPLVEVAIRPRGFAALKTSVGLIRAQRVRAIYLTDWPGTSLHYFVWRLFGVKHIVVHDHTPGDRGAATGLRRVLKRCMHLLRVFSPTLCVGVAEHIRDRHVENWRADPARCVTVTNGIPLFECGRKPRAEMRRELGVPEDAVMFAAACRATLYKGLDLAVRAVAALPADSRVHFVHCGEGPDLEAFRALAAQLGVSDRVHFLGRRNDVRDVLCAADAALHPSKGEAMSLAILEYLCAGLPVVVPDKPSVRAAVEDGVTGIVYKAGDTADAARALARLAGEATLRATMGKAARTSCVERYAHEVTTRQFAERVLPAL